jgi:hypothetical protein
MTPVAVLFRPLTLLPVFLADSGSLLAWLAAQCIRFSV